MDKISFQGNFISHLNIKRVDRFGLPVKVSIVEAEPVNNNDLQALRQVHELWNANFSNNIYKEAATINEIGIPDSGQRFFLLTRQKADFKTLNSEDVLAEAKVILDLPDKNSVYLDYLQVEPDNMYDSDCRVYKGIGSAFLDFFKKIYKGKEIRLHSVSSALDFYEHNGFKPVHPSSNSLYFRA